MFLEFLVWCQQARVGLHEEAINGYLVVSVVPDVIAQVGPDTRGTKDLLCLRGPFSVLDRLAKVLFLKVFMINNSTCENFLGFDEFDGPVCRCISHYYYEGERYPILRLLYLVESMSQPNLHGLKTLTIFGFDGPQEALEQDWSLAVSWKAWV